jgi:HAD superfamily hydrolase (TIGR01450 family)
MMDGSGLRSCEQPLWSAYDVAILDLDGVVYIGPDAVPGAAEHLGAASQAGMALAYVTNNAARTPRTVATHLVELGMPAAPDDVVTSAQAAARLVSEVVDPGSPVYVIGGDGLFEALEEQGLRPVQRIEDEPRAVVSGYHPELRWKTVIDGAILVRRGTPWFASNTDMSVPTPHGPGPGNGVLVEAVARFAAVAPVVAGKPEPPLFHETLRRVGGRRPLVVGDRLDTDIEGAVRAGYDSLLVMTGVTGLEELAAAAPGARPTYVSMTLAGIGRAHEAPVEGDDGWCRGGWRATTTDATLTVERVGEGEGAPDDWLAVAAAAAWSYLDTHGEPVRLDGVTLPAG